MLFTESTLVSVIDSGVRPAGPAMLIAGAPEVAMSPLVEEMVPVLFEASRPRRFASGVMSRSAKVMLPVLLDRSTPSPAELLTVVLPKLAATAELDIKRPMPALFWRLVVPEVNVPLPPLMMMPLPPLFDEMLVKVRPRRGVGQRGRAAARPGLSERAAAGS